MSDLVNLKIDGKPVSVPRGTLVVDAAAKVGVEVPVFCYHPKLDPVGACRMCLVEIGAPRMGPDRKPVIDEKTGEVQIAMMPKLQTACTSPVSEGMVVLTGTNNAATGRRSVLEFLLTNHPLDCPVCDKGGECPLQDNTFKYGPGDSRFVEPKRHYQKPIPLSDRVVLDRERCILCYRCVRFQAEIAGDESLTTINRGSYSEIGVMPGKTFDSIFSGNTIEMCPVGALTSSKYRFKARPWDIKHIPSVCAECSVGCNVRIDVRENQIARLMSRENTAVDDSWLCDRGRFSFDYVHADNRLTRPMIRRDGKLTPVAWEEALRTVANRLRFYVQTYGPQSVAGVASPDYPNEALFAFKRLFGQLGSNLIDHAPRATTAPIAADVDAIHGSIAGVERAKVILVVGGDTVDQQPVFNLRLKKAIRKKGAQLVLIHPEPIDLTGYAKVWLQPKAAGQEPLVMRGLLRAMVEVAPEGGLGVDLDLGFGAPTLEQVAQQTGVAASQLRAAAKLIVDAVSPALIYPRDFDEAWRPGLTALTKFALTKSVDAVSFVGGLVRHSSSQGALDLGLLPPGGYAETVADRAARGEVKALYALGSRALDSADVSGVEFLVVQDYAHSALLERADIVLPGTVYAENGGTLTNLERRVQRLTPAKLAPGQAREDWRTLVDVAKALGAGYDYPSAREVFRDLARTTPRYADLTWERVGRGGQQWSTETKAPAESAAAD